MMFTCARPSSKSDEKRMDEYYFIMFIYVVVDAPTQATTHRQQQQQRHATMSECTRDACNNKNNRSVEIRWGDKRTEIRI